MRRISIRVQKIYRFRKLFLANDLYFNKVVEESALSGCSILVILTTIALDYDRQIEAVRV